MAYGKLAKILRLEQSRGYRDEAVMGGLESFARNWREEAVKESQDDAHTEQIHEIANLLFEYKTADKARRAEIVSTILEQVEEESSDMGPRIPPPQKPGSQVAPRPTPPADPKVTPSPAPVPPARPTMGLDAPVSTLPGVSTAYSSKLRRLGIETVGDLLYHFPHRYDDYTSLKTISQLEYGDETTIVGTIWETHSRKMRSGRDLVTSLIADASGTIEAVWYNQPYLARQLRAGRRIVLSGKVDEYLGRLTLQSPVWEPLERELIHTARLVPIYSLTQGVTSRWIRRYTKRVVDHWAPRIEDYLPAYVRERNGLVDLATALRQIHFPDDLDAARAARRRLSFDEFLLIQLGVLAQRHQWQSQPGEPIPTDRSLLEGFVASLPFQLTAAQKQSIEQILHDMAQPRPMSRLLQGDVGSGKTVVAAAAMLMAVATGRQAALMAPTEILAEQHHRTLSELLAGLENQLGRPVSVVLLTGSLSRVERGKVYTAVASGEADVVIGTHALVQKHVTFQDLALAIVDEQHRFGVLQRGTLRGKGGMPHMLVMSATPIPRSMALTIYGDLDLSVVDELPPGRQEIETRWLLSRERERAYAFIRSQIEKGRQAFILYPLVEESDKVEARAAVEEYEALQQVVFPDLDVALLHGRMKGKEKDAVMQRFRDGQTHILVSTSVIEVGIDVPNATVMLIEGADRFGLAQLHQFRGRVGRGEHRSYCLLLSDTASPDNPETRSTWERLKAIEDTQDGFVLAEKDLELRGPGDFFGVRQSGLPALRLASLGDVKTLEQARSEAQAIFREDPELGTPEFRPMLERLQEFWDREDKLS